MSLIVSPELFADNQQIGIDFGEAPFAQADARNSKPLFRCVQDAAARIRGNATGTECNFTASTIGDVRKHQVRVHKNDVYWHSGCQSHILGTKADYDSHVGGCDIRLGTDTNQAAKERAWRDLFRKLEPGLPFPLTPYKNRHTWFDANVYELRYDYNRL